MAGPPVASLQASSLTPDFRAAHLHLSEIPADRIRMEFRPLPG
jgi:hypothetical protein